MIWRHIAILLCGLFLIPLASATPTNLTLEANPNTVIADGYSYSKVRANLTNESGSPVVGAYINFTIGSRSLVVKTNSSGIATIVVGPSSSVRTVVITASNLSGSPTNSTNVSFVPGAPASIYLYASPSSVGTRSITSNYTSLITALVVDAYRNPVPNQQVNFTIYLRKSDGTISNPPNFTLNPNGTADGSGNVSITIPTINGSATLTFNASNTSGTAYITASFGNLTANSALKIMGESYLLVETSVEPLIINPPPPNATVNVTISVKGGGDKWLGGKPVDAMLVTDVSGSMDPDWYNSNWGGGEQYITKGFTEYKFKASGTVQSGNWSNITFYLNESVNDLWFKLNVTGLRLQVISPNGTKYGYYGNGSKYMYSKNYSGTPSCTGIPFSSSGNPEWVWLRNDTKPQCNYIPSSKDLDSPEQGNWTIKVYNPGSSPTFNITTYIEKLSAVKISSKTFTGLLNPDHDRIGLVPFTSYTDPLPLYNLTSNTTSINGAIDSMYARGGTPTAAAIKTAADHLNQSGRQDALRYIILLSDGQPNVGLGGDPVTDAINEANKARNNSIKIYSIGIGVDADMNFMSAIAYSNDTVYYAANASQLKEIYGNIAKQITDISAQKASLNISLSSGQSYSANATYVQNSSRETYITSNNTVTNYSYEPNTTSPLYWDIKTPNPPDNKTIKIGDQWILKFQLNLSNDGMLFDLEKSIVGYMNYTGGNLSTYIPGAKVSKNATTLKPRGLNVSRVNLTAFIPGNKNWVRANGVSKSILTAEVRDEEGNLVPEGTEVVFQIVEGPGTFMKGSIQTIYLTNTTVDGIATVEIYSNIVGTARILAESRAGPEIQPVYVPSDIKNIEFKNSRIITIS